MAPIMYDKVVSVISKPPVERSIQDIRELLPWLRKRSTTFSNVESDVLVDLLRHCAYRQVARDTVIIRQGDLGDTFYVMLTGSTSVYIHPIQTAEQEGPLSGGESATSPPSQLPGGGQKEPARDRRDQEGQAGKPAKSTKAARFDRSILGNFLVKFEAGRAFGELALMSEESIRNASIVADEDTDLLTINRDLFNRSLKLEQEEEYEDRRLFVRDCPLFRSWSPKFQRLLEMSIHKQVFPFGSTIVRQGDAVQGLHFIVTGRATVTVKPALHKQQYPKCFTQSTSSTPHEFRRTLHMKEERVRQSVQRPQVRVRRKLGYAAAERRLAEKSVTVSCLDRYEVIGDVEIILGLDTYTNTVVCTAHTDTFLLDIKNLERLVYKKNGATMDALTKSVRDKLCSRMRSPQVSQQVQLYKHLHDKVLELQPAFVGDSSAANMEGADWSDGAITPRTAGRNLPGARTRRMEEILKLKHLFPKDKPPPPPPMPSAAAAGVDGVENGAGSKTQRKAETDPRKARSTTATVTGGAAASIGNVRLERARRNTRRKPLSRRQLERMCAGEPANSAGDRYRSSNSHLMSRHTTTTTPDGRPGTATPGSNGRSRLHTATGNESTSVVSCRQPVEVTVTSLTPQKRPAVLDFDTAVGHLLGTHGSVYGDPDAQQFDADDIDVDVLRHVMADMGGFRLSRQNSRTKSICSMLERKARQSPVRSLLRPKSAPTALGISEDLEPEDAELLDHFDWDTSEPALRTLEQRIRRFLDKSAKCSTGAEQNGNGSTHRSRSAMVSELKRFVVENPEDIPIPGGAVYVRQKHCRYLQGVPCPNHNHVRRYMIPKNAYSLASYSIAELNRDPGPEGWRRPWRRPTDAPAAGRRTSGNHGPDTLSRSPHPGRHGTGAARLGINSSGFRSSHITEVQKLLT